MKLALTKSYTEVFVSRKVGYAVTRSATFKCMIEKQHFDVIFYLYLQGTVKGSIVIKLCS